MKIAVSNPWYENKWNLIFYHLWERKERHAIEKRNIFLVCTIFCLPASAFQFLVKNAKSVLATFSKRTAVERNIAINALITIKTVTLVGSNTLAIVWTLIYYFAVIYSTARPSPTGAALTDIECNTMTIFWREKHEIERVVWKIVFPKSKLCCPLKVS